MRVRLPFICVSTIDSRRVDCAPRLSSKPLPARVLSALRFILNAGHSRRCGCREQDQRCGTRRNCAGRRSQLFARSPGSLMYQPQCARCARALCVRVFVCACVCACVRACLRACSEACATEEFVMRPRTACALCHSTTCVPQHSVCATAQRVCHSTTCVPQHRRGCGFGLGFRPPAHCAGNDLGQESPPSAGKGTARSPEYP